LNITTLSNPDRWLVEELGGGKVKSGVVVNEQSALRVTAYLAAVKIISETVASLPLIVYRRIQPRGKERAPDHPLYTVLHDQANSEMTAYQFRETLQGHILNWGNGYAEIERDGAGRVIGLWPLLPDRTWPERDQETQRLQYRTILPDGQQILLPSERVLHIPGFGFDGLVGYNPVKLAREAIGMALAAEQFGADFFGNGAKPSGIVEYPGRLSDEAYKRYKEEVQEAHGGLGKQHRLMVLEEGLKYHQVTIPPEEAQFLETRKFQVAEIARIFRVPPHMLGDLERATFSNIEHQSIEFVVHTIRPWLVRWEQAIRMKLLTPAERREFFAEFLVDGLLRGDIESRYNAYAVGRQNGWLSANDIREMENMNPVPGGDVYMVNGNMVPIDQAGEGGENNNG
jgi:HK97 family phage portal protein